MDVGCGCIVLVSWLRREIEGQVAVVFGVRCSYDMGLLLL